MEAAIAHYGLIALLLGAAIEGEPFVVAGGVLAHRGLLPLWAVAASSIAGAVLVDQLWFWAARRGRDNRWVAGVRRRPAFARSIALLERHRIGFLSLFRFAYGVRAVAPVAIGLSRVPASLFAGLEAAAAIVWGLAFTALGWASGPLFERLSARWGGVVEAAAILVSAGALAFVLRRGPADRRLPAG